MRTKGDGSLFQRGDGMWVGRVELPRSSEGKRQYKYVSSKNRNTALAKLKKLRAEVDSDRIVASSSMSVEKWLEVWLNDIHRNKIRPGTFAGYERIIRLHINPRIGSRRLDQLTATHVRNMCEGITSSRNAQIAYDIIHRSLHDAEREGMLSRNVASIVDKPGHVKEERQPLSSAQAKQLLASTASDPLHSRWMAALYLGARQGELLGLQWDRIDLTTGVVDFSWQLQQLTMIHGCGEAQLRPPTVSPESLVGGRRTAGRAIDPADTRVQRHGDKTWPCGRKLAKGCPQKKWDFPRGFEYKPLHGSLVLTRPKTKKGTRIVPIPAPLWRELEKHHASTIDDINPHDLVWHKGGNPISRYDDSKEWHRQLKRAKLPAFPLHSARHSTATLLLQAGVPEEIRMSILGHAGALVTRTYAHVDISLERAAMDRAFKELT